MSDKGRRRSKLLSKLFLPVEWAQKRCKCEPFPSPELNKALTNTDYAPAAQSSLSTLKGNPRPSSLPSSYADT